jgi:hypothetical protein
MPLEIPGVPETQMVLKIYRVQSPEAPQVQNELPGVQYNEPPGVEAELEGATDEENGNEPTPPQSNDDNEEPPSLQSHQ